MTDRLIRAVAVVALLLTAPAFSFYGDAPAPSRDGGGNDIHDVNRLWLYVNVLLNLGTYRGGYSYYGDANYPGGNAQGNMWYGGPWIGSDAYDSPRVMNYMDLWSFDFDWSPSQPCVYWSDEPTWSNVPKKYGPYSDLDSYLGCSDSRAGQNRIGLAVQQHGMSWADEPNADFGLFKYYIYNRSGRDLTDLRVSFVYDLEIEMITTYDDDMLDVDTGRNMVYMYNDGPAPPYIGLRLVDGKASGAHGFLGALTPTTDYGRWQEMVNTGWEKSTSPGDWVAVLNSGPYTVKDGERFSVGLAVVGGMSLAELRTHADAAYNKYWEIYTGLTDFAARAVPRGVALTWTPEQPYAGYNLYRAADGDAQFEKLNLSPVVGEPPFTYVDAAVAPRRTYAYKLEALTAAGHSEWFGPVEVETADAAKSSFAVLGPRPNPVQGRAVFAVTLAEPRNVTVAAFDLAGRRVASSPPVPLGPGEHDLALDATAWPPGVYVYRVSAGDESACGKMVVAR